MCCCCVRVFRFSPKIYEPKDYLQLFLFRIIAQRKHITASSDDRERERELSCVCVYMCVWVSLFGVDTKLYSLLGHIFRLMCAPAFVRRIPASRRGKRCLKRKKWQKTKNTDNRKHTIYVSSEPSVVGQQRPGNGTKTKCVLEWWQ